MPSNELQVSLASNRGTWMRTVLWLVGLALLFLVFAQLATGSDLFWNDSTFSSRPRFFPSLFSSSYLGREHRESMRGKPS